MKTSHETAAPINDLSARCPVLADLPSTETFCVVATLHNDSRFIYATAQTQTGASLIRDSLNERGFFARIDNAMVKPKRVKIVKLDTPAFRAADYMMTALERGTALHLALASDC